MKKLLFTIVLSFVFVFGFSTELPKETKIKESTIKVESWMLNVFVPSSNNTVSIVGVAENGEEYNISLTEEKFHYNGSVYDVYSVTYENDSIKIAVHKDTFVALCEDFIIFYQYNNQNFGLNRILFNKPGVQKTLDHNEYRRQTELTTDKLDSVQYITLIVENFPLLKN